MNNTAGRYPASPTTGRPVRPPLGTPKPLQPKPPKTVEPDTALLGNARRSGEAVEATMLTGETLTGKVVAYGLYSVALEIDANFQTVVYKHGIASLKLTK